MSRQQIQDYQNRAELALARVLPSADIQPQRLHDAMRYSTLGGGKRLRPILVYATGSALGVALETLDAPACAVELIHAYSLIHDDLPAMDDDDLRRGKPTCHRAFDAATAILAGDALQALAFQVLTQAPMAVSADARVQMLQVLAQASGSRGMVGGQAIDLSAVGRELSLAELENMHIHKTGALIRASVLLGASCSPDLDRDARLALDHYAKCIGLAFQIQDDILDVSGDTATLGKTQGADNARNKPTYPALLGLEVAREHARDLVQDALESLNQAQLGDKADLLRWLAQYIIERTH